MVITRSQTRIAEAAQVVSNQDNNRPGTSANAAAVRPEVSIGMPVASNNTARISLLATTANSDGKRAASVTSVGGSQPKRFKSVSSNPLQAAAAEAAIRTKISNGNDALTENNIDILKKRLGENFVEIMNSPGVAEMVKGIELESNFDMQAGQDSALAKRFADASAIPLPKNIKPGEFIVAPLDIMPYRTPGSTQLQATLLELNGTGYGNITTMEPNMLKSVMHSFGNIESILKEDPNAVFVIASSGREDPPKFGASKKIHEKLMIGSAMVTSIHTFQEENAAKDGVQIHEELMIGSAIVSSIHAFQEENTVKGGAPKAGVKFIGLDTFDESALVLDELGQVIMENSKVVEKKGMDKDGIAEIHNILDREGWSDAKQPAVIAGYTAQLARAIQIRDGAPYLNGRKVNLINNDRLVMNINALNKNGGAQLDTGTFISSNKTFLAAASKGHAYAFTNEFNKAGGAEFPGFSREIINHQANTIEEVFSHVIRMLAEGKRAIIKPSGTGHGDGIVPFDLDELTDHAAIRMQIEDSYARVKGTYGDRGGFPYAISEYLTAARVNRPDSDVHTMKYEFRVAVFADYSNKKAGPQLKAHPSIIKIDGGSALAEGESGDFSKQLASVSAQVLATGLPASDFMKPLSSPEVLELLGISEAEVTDLCKYATRLVAHSLENVERAETIMNRHD